MRILFQFILTVGVVFFSIPSLAENHFSLDCPRKIEVTQKITKEHSGWRSFTNKTYHYLNNVAFYHGKPEEMANLKPESQDRHRATWNFLPQSEIYAVCEYHLTAVQLKRVLPVHTRDCTVYYDSEIDNYLPASVKCSIER